MAAVETPEQKCAPRRSGCGSSPRKARLVAEHIRGRSVPEARTVLAFTQRAAAARDREGAAVRRRERGGEPRPGRRRAARLRAARRRGADAQALARTRARPRRPDPQAHLPHHDSRSSPRTRWRTGGAPRGCAGRGAEAPKPKRAAARRRPPQSKPKPRPSVTGEEEGGGNVMGQKIHPGGMRVGVIHDWKSNWYTGKKEFPQYLLEDIKIREHITKKLSHAGLSDILIRKDKQRITVDIYTARPGIVIGKSGVEVDALRKDLHALTHEERPHQHQRDQAPGARREARRAVDRRAAAEPRQLPPRDEARARVGDPLRRAGRQDPVLRRPPRRRRDEPLARPTPRAACRCTRSAPTSTTASPRRRRPSAASASRSGSTRARSCRRATRASRTGDAAPRRPGSGAPPARRPAARASAPRARAAAAAASDREGLGPVRQRRRGAGRGGAAVAGGGRRPCPAVQRRGRRRQQDRDRAPRARDGRRADADRRAAACRAGGRADVRAAGRRRAAVDDAEATQRRRSRGSRRG